ncbi:MAG TPA: ABC transporter permease [Candidatus Didemnitutus sp.]|nr:ABC transporter permease [Candidatus Didemnitutus sp.]
MNSLRQALVRVFRFFRPRNFEAEMAEEMRQHLERRIQEKIDDGIAPHEAREAALRDFGGLTQVQEQCRDEHGFPPLETFAQDLRFAARALRKNPGFTAVVVLTLALGIGANATVLCWLRDLVLRPLPGVAAQERLVVIASNQGGGRCVSVDDLQDIAALKTVFDGAIVSQISSAALEVDRHSEWTDAQVVSADYFSLLGVEPLIGRTFLPNEDQKPDGDPVLVISERVWRRRFAAAPDVLGRTVELNRHAFTIVGVVPDSFHGTMPPSNYDLWAPRSMTWEVRNQRLIGRSARGWHNLARLKPGVTLAQANAAVATLDEHLARAYPDTNREVHHRVLPLSEAPWGGQTTLGPVLRLLLAVVGGVLLIVAANIASLLLARATVRQREIAIRLAAGASRTRLIRLFLTESFLLALLGGGLGLLFARGGIASLPYLLSCFLPKLSVPLFLEFHLDGATLGLTVLVTLATGITFGLVPALQASRSDLNTILKQGGRTGASGAAQHRLRNVLVVAEIALALVMLVSAGLCVKGLERARQVDFGFAPDHVLTASLQIGMNGYTPETGPAFYRQARARLATLPGVEEAAFASWFPLGFGGDKGADARVEGYVRPPGEDPTYEFAIISPRYFAAMRIPLLAGRDFTDQDDAAAPNVAIVNQAFAQRFWPGQDPIGRRFWSRGGWRTIVGMTSTGKYNRLDEPAHCFFYLPYQQGVPELDLNLCLRLGASNPAEGGTTDDAAAAALRQVEGFASTLRQALHAIDPAVELLQTQPLAAQVAVFFSQRLVTTLLLALGGVALLLAAMGVYAVMAYAVSQRTQEFGVRMALGATAADVFRHVIRQGLILAGGGVAAGIVLAFAVTHLLANFLYGVSPFDPTTFLGVPLVMAAVAVIACYLPARRATRVDPIVALRAE